MQSVCYKRFGKRLIDVGMTVIALALAWPVLLGLSMLVRMSEGPPRFVAGSRPGLAGGPFQLRKFRAVRSAVDAQGRPLPDAERLTRLGRWLRATSLDELPELWNVLRGDMSLVGPRPLLMEYLPLYSAEQARRHEVRPGITGWAQVNGRNSLSWEEKFELDVWYVEHQSLWLDIKIMAFTIRKVLLREGISAQGEDTMPRFTGSQVHDG